MTYALSLPAFHSCIYRVVVRASPSRRKRPQFANGVRKYVELQQYLEGSVSAQKSTNESEQITYRQQQLAGLIANARLDAYQGEVFTREVAEQFHKIIRKAFREPGGQAMRKTIQERDPVKPHRAQGERGVPRRSAADNHVADFVEPAPRPAEGTGISHHRPCPCSAGYQDEFDCGLHP